MDIELSDDERTHLGMLAMNILDEWRLAPVDQLALMGMPEKTKPRELSRYRNGTTPLPKDPEVIRHARHVLGIQESLHVIFPLNGNMPSFWLKHRNKVLRGIPLEIMLDEGISGMSRVWRQLDCTQNWTD